MSEDVRDKALCRYQVISAYVALDPPRGQRRQLLEQLAARTWTDPDGEPWHVAAETIRSWVRRYRNGGLEALSDKPRPQRGVAALTAEQVELVCALKREVPERSLDRIIKIIEGMGMVERGVVRRSTLHRVLRKHGLSQRACRIPDAQDLDRFEADHPNDLWQSDMLTGPWLPDPQRPGKMRRAYLYAFLDDHSRALLHGRFSFKGELPALELVFRRALQRWGKPRRVYYDNGQVYRSHQMKRVVAAIGTHRLIFTTPHRPMGHGKIEALNRFIRANFLAELKASRVSTLDELNEAFVAWADLSYNRRVHAETGQQPLDRWRAGSARVDYADEELLRDAFLWREHRTPDKTGMFSLFAVRYQVDPGLARKRIEVRYDPEALEEVEVWHDDQFKQRATPFEVRPDRRPKKPALVQEVETDKAPVADWLGHLVSERRSQFVEHRDTTAEDLRAAADDRVCAALEAQLDPAVFDTAAVRAFLAAYGPFDTGAVEQVLDSLIDRCGRSDQHIAFYLDAIKTHARRKS